MITRRIFAAVIAMTFVLAACGDDQSDTADGTADSTTTSEATPDSSNAPVDTTAPDASAWEPIVVEHVYG